MSNSVESKAVQLKFDNKQFETGVKTSLTSLEKLDKKLKMEDGTSGLANVGKAMKEIKTEKVTSGVQELANKFSVLNTVAFTTIQRITNAAIDMGEKIAKALTIKPAIDGYNEYKTKLDAIKVIQANVADSVTSADIKNTLAELNTYADKTIYNFGDMTTAIGKFTNAGADLKQSATAIKGLANIAAGSGTDPTRLAGAYTQIAQALQSGKFMAIDWMSMLTANLSSPELQRRLTETGKAMGHARDETVSFKDSLKSGWLTSDVFLKVMEQAADETNEWGAKLTVAATQVREFHQLIDVMNEDIGSSWATTWELIVGDSDESAEWFTNLAMFFSNLTSKSNDARNKMLKQWHDMGGRMDVVLGINNVLIGLSKTLGAVKSGFEYVFPPITASKLKVVTEHFKKLSTNLILTDDQLMKVKKIAAGVASVFGIVTDAVSAVLKRIIPGSDKLSGVGNKALDVLSNFGTKIVQLRKWEQESKIFDKAVDRIAGGINKFKDAALHFGELVKEALGLKDIEIPDIKMPDGWKDALLNGDLSKKIETVKKILNGYYDAFMDFHFDKPIVNLKKNFEKVTKLFSGLKDGAPSKDDSGFWKTISGIFDGIKDSIENIIDNAADIVDQIADKLHSEKAKKIIKDFDSVIAVLGGAASAILIFAMRYRLLKYAGDVFKSFGGIFGSISGVFKSMSGVIDEYKKLISAHKNQAKAAVVMEYAKAILLIAGSIALLASLDTDKMFAGLAVVSILIVELAIVMKLTDRLAARSTTSFKNMITVLIGALGVAGMVMMFVDAIKTLGGMKQKKLIQGMVAFFILLVASLATVFAASKMVKPAQVASVMAVTDAMSIMGDSMIKMSIALVIISYAIKMVAKLKPEQLKGAVIAIASLIGAMSVGVALMSIAAKGLRPRAIRSIGKNLIAIAASMVIMSYAIKTLSKLKPEQLVRGTATIGALLLFIGLFKKFGTGRGLMGNVVGAIVIASLVAQFANIAKQLGKMKPEEAEQGVLCVGAILGLISLFKRYAVGGNLNGIAKNVTFLAVAVTTMAGATKTLGTLKPEEAQQGIVCVAAIIGLIGMFKMFAKGGGLTGIAKNVTFLAVAVATMSGVVQSLGKMDPGKVEQGLVSLAGIVAIIGLFKRFAEGAGFTKLIPGLLGLTMCVTILGGVVGLLGTMNPKQALTGVLVLGAIFGEIALFKRFANGLGLTGIAAGLLATAVSMVLIGRTLMKLGEMSFEQVGASLTAMAGALLIMVGIGALVSKLHGVSVSLAGFGTALVPMAAGLASVTPILITFALLPIDKVVVGLTMLAGALLIFTGVGAIINMMPGLGASLTAFGIGLIPLAIALLIFAPALKQFSDLPWGQVADTLKVFGMALLGVVGIGALAKTFAKGILVLGVAFVAMGAAVMLAGEGLNRIGGATTKIATGMIFLAHACRSSADDIASGFDKIASRIITIIPNIIKAIAEGIVEFAEVIIANGDTVTHSVIVVGEAILNSIGALVPRIAQVGTQIVIEFISNLVANAKTLVVGGMLLISELLHGLAEGAPLFIKSGVLLMVRFLTGLADAIRDNAVLINYAITSLFESVLEFVLTGLEQLVGWIPGIGDDCVEGLEKAKKGLHDVMLPEAMEKEAKESMDRLNAEVDAGEEELKSKIGNFANDIKDGSEPANQAAEESGKNMTQHYISGASSADSKAALAMMARQTQEDVAEYLKDDEGLYNESGHEGIGGYFDGMTEGVTEEGGTKAQELVSQMSSLVSNEGQLQFGQTGTDLKKDLLGAFSDDTGEGTAAGSDAMNTVVNGAKEKSKDLLAVGKSGDDQMASGVRKGKSTVKKACQEVGESGKNGMKSGIKGANDIGAQATQGFANGIRSKWQEVSKAGTYIGEEALKAAKKALDERSPSHKMFDIGDFATLGFINGGKSRSKEVSTAYGSLGLMAMDAIVNAFNDSENASTGLIPEIKPVLNTSAFENSLSSLQTMMNGGSIVANGTLVVVQKSPELEELVTLNRQLINEVRNGHEIYMDGQRLVGYVNRKLGEA